MSEQGYEYENGELAQLVSEYAKAVISNSQRNPHQREIEIIEKYCDGHHSAMDGCYCSILIALIKGEQK